MMLTFFGTAILVAIILFMKWVFRKNKIIFALLIPVLLFAALMSWWFVFYYIGYVAHLFVYARTRWVVLVTVLLLIVFFFLRMSSVNYSTKRVLLVMLGVFCAALLLQFVINTADDKREQAKREALPDFLFSGVYDSAGKSYMDEEDALYRPDSKSGHESLEYAVALSDITCLPENKMFGILHLEEDEDGESNTKKALVGQRIVCVYDLHTDTYEEYFDADDLDFYASPVISEDLERVYYYRYFSSDEPGTNGFYRFDKVSGKTELLCELPRQISPDFIYVSPDESYLYFTVYSGGGAEFDRAIWRVDIAAGQYEGYLTTDSQIFEFLMSKDGTRMVHDGGTERGFVVYDTTRKEVVATIPRPGGNGPYDLLAISDDNRYIAMEDSLVYEMSFPQTMTVSNHIIVYDLETETFITACRSRADVRSLSFTGE